jgi:hypothetical protein
MNETAHQVVVVFSVNGYDCEHAAYKVENILVRAAGESAKDVLGYRVHCGIADY